MKKRPPPCGDRRLLLVPVLLGHKVAVQCYHACLPVLLQHSHPLSRKDLFCRERLDDRQHLAAGRAAEQLARFVS